MIKKTIFLILFVQFYQIALSQDFCAQKLSEAEDKFDQGKFYEIPDLLSICINNGFSREERIRAYRLLTITYLYLDYPSKADDSYLELLKLSPEFDINEESDPRELINHHQKFTTRPFVYLMAKGGANSTYYNAIFDISMVNSTPGSQDVRPLVGYNLGLGAEFTLYKNLHLGTELLLTQKSFEYSNEYFQTRKAGNEQEFYQVSTLRQFYTGVEIPVYLKYSFYKPKISPFIYFGASPSFLLAARFQNMNRVIQAEDENNREIADIDIYEFRRKFNYALLGGVGVKYKIGINYLTLEMRYQTSMFDYVDPKDRWNSSSAKSKSLKYPLGYVDDYFKLSNVSVMAGFVYPLYKPRKITR